MQAWTQANTISIREVCVRETIITKLSFLFPFSLQSGTDTVGRTSNTPTIATNPTHTRIHSVYSAAKFNFPKGVNPSYLLLSIRKMIKVKRELS